MNLCSGHHLLFTDTQGDDNTARRRCQAPIFSPIFFRAATRLLPAGKKITQELKILSNRRTRTGFIGIASGRQGAGQTDFEMKIQNKQ
jgi:hypothetical protein